MTKTKMRPPPVVVTGEGLGNNPAGRGKTRTKPHPGPSRNTPVEHRHARHGGLWLTDTFAVELPYCEFICASGRRVLLNRLYEPMFERLPDGAVRAANPAEWVENIVDRQWFYNDGNPPRHDRKTLARCRAVLTEFGITAELQETLEDGFIVRWIGGPKLAVTAQVTA